MNRRGIIIALASAIVLTATTAGAVWATTYDRHGTGRLLPGTTIEGVPVGGMRTEAAVRLLRERIEAPLHRPVQLRLSGFETTTTAWDLGLRVDVAAAVRKAMGEVGGNLLSRAWGRLFSEPEKVVSATPRWQGAELEQVLDRVSQAVATPAQDAKVDSSSGWVTVVRERAGRELDRERSREAIRDSVQLGDDLVYLSTREVPAAVGRDAFQKVILIRSGENKLYLYENGSITKEWPVATGASGYATPTGTWRVVEKLINPTWYNPGSAWARGMPARIGPGPSNPLGTHALALDAPAILIHATPDRSSIGYSVSHGCVRMLPEHEIELFGMVDVGTPVVVVDVGTPKPRDSVTPTGDAAQLAARQF